MVMDLIALVLQSTKDHLCFFTPFMRIFETELVPVLESMFKAKSQEHIVGMRLMKCSIMIMNQLCTGLHMLHYVLADADTLVQKCKDGSVQINLTWKQLIAFECLTIAVSNPVLIKVLSVTQHNHGRNVSSNSNSVSI